MIVLSRSLLLSPTATEDLRQPFLLWRNILAASMLSATSSATGYPVSNLVNVSTIERWQAANGVNAPCFVTMALADQWADTIGIARHNFGSGLIAVAVEGREPGETDWTLLCDDYLAPDDRPIIFRFAKALYADLRLRLMPAGAAPQVAVLYAGVALVMQHGIAAPHVPLDQAHETQAVNGMSESGEYLGRIITGQTNRTSAQWQNLDIDWYYDTMEPFVARGASAPFFFAWFPADRPRDVGYSWLSTDPKPSFGSLYVDVSLDFGGIVR